MKVPAGLVAQVPPPVAAVAFSRPRCWADRNGLAQLTENGAGEDAARRDLVGGRVVHEHHVHVGRGPVVDLVVGEGAQHVAVVGTLVVVRAGRSCRRRGRATRGRNVLPGPVTSTMLGADARREGRARTAAAGGERRCRPSSACRPSSRGCPARSARRGGSRRRPSRCPCRPAS